ncbi:hypothetical protein ACEWY4_009364 [Coilia grayii]|uniref:DnaJ homolog subfamily C member 30, mitochondrial n=1 Tax=Coilia grayii TaxID=363190 RepID=A0ABD1K686_9TELE
MAEVRMVMGRKVYKILKSSCSPALSESTCTSGHSRALDAVSNAFALREIEEAPPTARIFSKQTPLPTTTSQEHGADLKIDIHRDSNSGFVFWKRSDICPEDTGKCLDCKGKTLPRDRPAKRPPHGSNGVTVWWNPGNMHQKNVCRSRRDLTRTFCTHRNGASKNGFSSPPLLFRRCFSNSSYDAPLFQSKTAYYEILEVSTTATQAQIKTAYYKQSFIYHPDKNAGSEHASRRFAQISEAYNVLGNKLLRKKYDRGILTQTDLQGARRPSSKETSATSSVQQKMSHSAVGGVDSKKIYDFDNFIKSHYSEQLQRERDFRSRQDEFQRKKEAGVQGRELGRRAEVYVGMLLAVAIGLFLSMRSVK